MRNKWKKSCSLLKSWDVQVQDKVVIIRASCPTLDVVTSHLPTFMGQKRTGFQEINGSLVIQHEKYSVTVCF